MSSDLCHCIALRKASRKVSSIYDAALEPLGVNVAQFSLLRNIARMAPVSLTDLGARVALDRSTVGRNARVLERMGLVISGPGEDQREAVLTISDKGHQIIAQGNPLWDGAQRAVEERLGPGNIEQLRTLLALL